MSSFLANPPSFSSFPDLDPGPSKKFPEGPKPRTRSRSPSDKSHKRERRSREGNGEHHTRKGNGHRSSSRERRHKRSRKADGDRGRLHRERKTRRDHEVEENSLERKHPRKDNDSYREEHAVSFADDERLKAKEDASRKNDAYFDPISLSTPGFYSDKRGDPLNLQYGRLDSKQIPAYHHVAGGRFILGLQSGWRVTYRSSKGVEVARGGDLVFASLTDSSSRAMLKAPPTERLVHSGRAAAKYVEVEGFIRLRNRHQPSTPRDKSIEPGPDMSGSEWDASTTSMSQSSDEEAAAPPVSAYQARLIELERQVKEQSTSTVSWLSLLSHMLSQHPITARNAVKARAEVTLSVLDRALASLPSGTQATILRLRRLQAGEELWATEHLAKEWAEAFKLGGADLRLAWLEWRIRKGEGGVDGVLADAEAVLAALSGELERLRAFWRTAVFLRQAGFAERAMAMFQAQAELMSCVPKALLKSSLADQLNSLEEYWEAEVSRAGEPGARGWAAWIEAGKPDAGVPITSIQPPVQAPLPDPYERWSQNELAVDSILRPPLRSTDPAAELDPYSTILFSDLRPFLFPLTTARGKNAFRLVWLSFLGLHVPGLESLLNPQFAETADDRWTETHLASAGMLDRVFPLASPAHRIAADAQAGVLVGKEEQYATSFGPVKHWAHRVLGPLEGMDFVSGAGWPLWTSADVRDVDVGFVRNIFSVCRTGSDDVEWDGLTLALEAAVNPKGAVKLSQSFLANAQESLPRWAIHARLERLRSRPAAARKVYENVLSAPFSSANRLSTGPLWWDWAEMEWLAGDAPTALRVVLRAAGLEGNVSSGVAALRAKQTLEATAREIPAMLWKVREAWVRLGALLELLAGANLPLFVTTPITAGAFGAEDESRAVAALGMLYHHVVTLRSATRPAVLREQLDRAVEMFPDNTALLGMYLEMQKGQGVWGRVRELIGEDREKGVARRVADVWIAGWERGRWEWELERTRTGLEAAVSSERTRGSAVLWRVYVEFEIRAGDLRKAKDVFFRAIGQCPLVKGMGAAELYMIAFSRLRSVLTVSELNGLGETMAERGIRTRASLEEALEGWTEARGDTESVGSEEDEDEMEYEARETERLKPY
ncbi:NRDE-2, necessary for RNA interference-domain-containing protein [Vararia minispora EC-137]|uniref:NRDE-2, necessary for RNA interference-domain-containing protein n=1 Tax=Vararia minispora EC-137 TaxID=1314806 RepID=A0ACB8QRY4_9AGAM|nr:NRDE-2, necessary for RNA interference-domain-containing protein [Vararia minispora EC-137]